MDFSTLPPLPPVAQLAVALAAPVTTGEIVPAWCAADLGLGAEAEIRTRLAAREWTPVARRVYRPHRPGLASWLRFAGQAPAHLPFVAAALARQNNWHLAASREMALYAVQAGDRPLDAATFGYDGPGPRRLRCGLVLEPVAPDLAAAPLAVQLIVLGLGARLARLRAAERDALAARLAPMSLWQSLDGVAGACAATAGFRAACDVVAAIAERRAEAQTTSRTAQQAPPGWRPPANDTPVCRVDHWWIAECRDALGSYSVLRGRVLGHPYVGPTSFGFCSSPLLWIDPSRGYARAESRLYRLGSPRHAAWDD